MNTLAYIKLNRPTGEELDHAKRNACGKAFRRLTNNGKNYWISSVVEKSSCICKNQRLRESGVFDAFSILTYKLKENREVLIDSLIAQLERIQQRFGGADDRIGDIDKEIAQLCAQSHLLAKLNNNGILDSAEYAEQAAEIENKIKTLRTERRKKLSENQDDEMLDELKTLKQILDEYYKQSSRQKDSDARQKRKMDIRNASLYPYK